MGMDKEKLTVCVTPKDEKIPYHPHSLTDFPEDFCKYNVEYRNEDRHVPIVYRHVHGIGALKILSCHCSICTALHPYHSTILVLFCMPLTLVQSYKMCTRKRTLVNMVCLAPYLRL